MEAGDRGRREEKNKKKKKKKKKKKTKKERWRRVASASFNNPLTACQMDRESPVIGTGVSLATRTTGGKKEE